MYDEIEKMLEDAPTLDGLHLTFSKASYNNEYILQTQNFSQEFDDTIRKVLQELSYERSNQYYERQGIDERKQDDFLPGNR